MDALTQFSTLAARNLTHRLGVERQPMLADEHRIGGDAPAARSDLSNLASDFPAVLSLASLNGNNGFRIDGINAYDRSGGRVASAGDVNGDGFDEIVIRGLGESYIVFGKAGSFSTTIPLASLDGANGFTIDGDVSSVSSAGDVNGDGLDDILIGWSGGDPGDRTNAGQTFVVFGTTAGFPADFNLTGLDGSNGFRINGIDPSDNSGNWAASAGDVNGDGFDDIIIGAPFADPDGASYAGETYVVFGKAGGFQASLNLAALDGSNGFRLDGINGSDYSGYSVSSAGDVNGDGLDDLVIGAYGAAPHGSDSLAGQSYVVFGQSGGFAASLDLDALDGSNGFHLNGVRFSDFSGFSVSSAGDVNGDGFDDVLIGAFAANPNYVGTAGESYVVFGKTTGFAADVELADLDGSNGFRLDGFDTNDRSGRSVAGAGDVNGDGFDDVIIGALNGGAQAPGQSYVVFGKAGGFSANLDLSTLDGANGFRIDGIDTYDSSGFSVASAGDVDGDGFDDVIVGAIGADPGGNESAGESYVIFGRAPSEAVKRTGAAGDQAIRGGAFDDTLKGLGGEDTLTGGGGGDSLNGGGGRDWADYSFGPKVRADLLAPAQNTGQAAGDTYVSIENLRGSAFADELRGDNNANRIEGGGGSDIVLGRGGADTLAGDAGRDTLISGNGADRFELASAVAADRDAITDFVSGPDEIALDGAVFGLAEGALAPGRFRAGAAAGDADDRIIYKQSTGKLWFDADGDGAGVQVLIATLTPGTALAASDFVVI